MRESMPRLASGHRARAATDLAERHAPRRPDSHCCHLRATLMRLKSARKLKITVATDTYAQSCTLGRLANRAPGTPSAPGPSTQLVPASRHTFRHLGPKDLGSLAVGRGDPRRVDAESGRSSPTMAEAAGDGAEVNASRQ